MKVVSTFNLREAEEVRQLPTEVKKHFLEIISTFGQFGEQMHRKSDIRTIAETLGGIADAAQEYTLSEGGDWFDAVTIKRNMKELKSLHEQFQKEAIEARIQEQRLEALYEDMGHVLNRYFEIANVSEEVMRNRLGMKEAKYTNKLQFERNSLRNQKIMKNSYKPKENISEQTMRSIIRRIIISEGLLNNKSKLGKRNFKESILNEKQYDIGSGWMGNGLTVWNRAETESSTDDYKIIAHISNKGVLTIKDKEIPNDIKKMIQVWANSMKKGNRPPSY